LRTRSTNGAASGLNSFARVIASACVGKTSLALSELAFLTAKSPSGRFSTNNCLSGFVNCGRFCVLGIFGIRHDDCSFRKNADE